MTGVPTIPTIEDPKLVDRVLLEMQTTLTSEFILPGLLEEATRRLT